LADVEALTSRIAMLPPTLLLLLLLLLLLGQQGEETLELELLKTDSYDDVSKAVADKLKLDHSLKLRFTGKLVLAIVDAEFICCCRFPGAHSCCHGVNCSPC